MSAMHPIIEFHPWVRTASGQALLAWEQSQVDRLVADRFGFHALQLGLPELDGLRANRMPYRWLALDDALHAVNRAELSGAHLWCNFDALPFPEASMDLIVMPHVLELASDPHATLREVTRILVPDGRLMIMGFNPFSLWGARASSVLPHGEFVHYWRVRDWLRLLGFEVEAGCFGYFRPYTTSAQSCRTESSWMDRWGAQWLPALGAVYVVEAVKRTPGMRWVGRVRTPRMQMGVSRPAMVTREMQVDPVRKF